MAARNVPRSAEAEIRQRFRAAGMLAPSLAVLLSGCASQGPLHPPSLKLPAPVKELTADRIGEAVDLHWMTPSKTTDGVALARKHGAGPLTAEICRSETAAPATPCQPVSTVPVKAGEAGSFHDVLPSMLSDGPLRPLHYGVRVLNGAARGAAASVAAETLAGAAPPAVRALGAAPVVNGVALHWQPDTAAGGARTILRVERVRPTAQAQAAEGPPPHSDLLAVAPAEHDAGGAVDTGAKAGIEQRYTVFRTKSLVADGKTLTASSLPASVTVAAGAKAPPPPPPTGLEALVNTLAAPEVDLVWQPVEGAAAYLVFRAEGDGAAVRLTPEPITGLSYTDATVRSGARYRYSVASVDAGGSSGAPGADLVESVPQR